MRTPFSLYSKNYLRKYISPHLYQVPGNRSSAAHYATAIVCATGILAIVDSDPLKNWKSWLNKSWL